MCTISLISKNKRYSQIHDPILKLLHIIIVTAPYKHVVFTIFHNVKQPCLKPMKPDYDLGT